MQIFDYNVVTKLPELPVKSKTFINTINPHSYCMAEKDADFKNALLSSDVLLPDGIGIVWAGKVLKDIKISKIAGFDIFIYLLDYLEEHKGSCFFLGASQNELDLIRSKAAVEYPNITIGMFSPPFKSEFSAEDSKEMCDQVNAFKPDVLFVGMTAPKQEKWVHAHKNALNVQITCCIGAVFDFYAGTIKRSHPFWIKHGLEWLPRFFKEPKRLAERNLVSTPKFIMEVFKAKLTSRRL